MAKRLRDRPAFQALLDVALEAGRTIRERRRGEDGEEPAPADAPGAGDLKAVADRLEDLLEQNGVLKSQNDLEPWWQNRVKIGVTLTTISAALAEIGIEIPVAWIDTAVEWAPIVIGLAVTAIGALGSAKLAPIDWRRPWTLFGIGR